MEIVPATGATWEALADLFARSGGGDARFCWCLWWRVRAKDFAASTPAANREHLRILVHAGPPPGLVALEGGRAVGWVGLGPRTDFERIERSRVIPRVEGPLPWAVTCFVVAVDARGRGVATALLAAAVEHALADGAPAVEGYPVDLAAGPGGRMSDTGAYTGTRTMFERAGFLLAARTSSQSGGVPRVVMRLSSAEAGPSTRCFRWRFARARGRKLCGRLDTAPGGGVVSRPARQTRVHDSEA